MRKELLETRVLRKKGRVFAPFKSTFLTNFISLNNAKGNRHLTKKR